MGAAQGVGQRLLVDQAAASGIDDERGGSHQLQFARTDQVACLLGEGAGEYYEVRLR